MNIKKIQLFIVATASAFIALAGTAMAHVVVTPSSVGVASFQTFSVSVPTEKDVPTVALKLVIPAGLNEVVPTVKTGWQIDTKGSGDQVTEIDWTGGTIPVGLRDDFTFNAQAPANPTELHWKAYQTYADGSVVSWDAVPTGDDDANGDKGPYSITKVVNDLNQPAESTNNNGAYVVAVTALALAVLAVVKSFVWR